MPKKKSNKSTKTKELKTIKKIRQVRKRAPKSRRKDNIAVSGAGLSCGVMMKTDHYMALALRDNFGDVELITTRIRKNKKNNRILFFPLIRGIVFLLELLSVNFLSLFHKRKFVKKTLRQKVRYQRFFIRLQQYGLYVMYFIVAVGLFEYLFLRLQGWPGADVSLLIYNFFFTLFYLVIFTLFFIALSIVARDELNILFYHGAEHKVINAYESKERLTMANIKKQDLLDSRCGVVAVFWSMIFLSLFLLPFGWYHVGGLIGFVVAVGLMIIAFSFAYELIYYAVSRRGFLYVTLIRPLLFLQKLMIRNPEDEHIELGIMALKEVVKLESRR